MNLRALQWTLIPLVTLALACSSSSDDGDGDGDGGGSGDNDDGNTTPGTENTSSGGQSTVSETYWCSINGTCFECPTADDVSLCGREEPNDCVFANDSFCQ